MTVCGVTHLLLPASLAAVAVSAVTGHDLYGVLAALVTAAAIYVVGRIRGTTAACPVPVPVAPPRTRTAGKAPGRR